MNIEHDELVEKSFIKWSEKHVTGGLSGLIRKIFYAGWEAKEEFDRIESEEICHWHCEEDSYSSCWASSCGEHLFSFTDGTPKENGFIYCPYCGKLLIESEETNEL